MANFPRRHSRGVEPGNPSFRHGGYCTQLYPHATFAAMVTRLDVYVGQVVDKLKEKGLYDNTIIIFASDNGPHMEGGADPDFFNSNGIYRGYKRDLYEGGIRVPMIVAWPGKVAQGVETDFMCAFWDMLPTFRQILNPKSKPAKDEDGISLLPLLTGKKGQQEHEYLYFEFQELNGRQAVRKGNWKLVHMDVRGKKHRYELYNIAADPSERYNVINEHPDVAGELRVIMESAHTDNPDFPLF